MAISPISFTSNKIQTNLSPEQKEQRKEVAKDAAVAGGATGAGVQAARSAAAKNVGKKNISKAIHEAFDKTTGASKIVNQNSKEVSGIFNNFWKNAKTFANKFSAKMAKFQNSKYIAPIVKSPFMKKVAGAFGYGMAFFVLVTEVSQALLNGKIMVGDLKEKVAD